MKKEPIPPYILYYVFRHLRTPVRLLSADRKQLKEHVFPDFSDEEYYEGVMDAVLNRSRQAVPASVVVSIEQAVFYAFLPVRDCTAAVGPVRFSERYTCRSSLSLRQVKKTQEEKKEKEPAAGDGRMNEKQRAAEDGRMEEEAFKAWYPQVPEVSFPDYIECLLLISNSASDEISSPARERQKLLADHFLRPDADDLNMASLSRLLFDKRESNFVHNPFNHEVREVDAVERGDTEELEEIINEDYSGRYGTLSDDPLRQEIYLGIIVVTLASRAAIRGGLSPEAAFYLSDNYIQALEKCTTPISAIHTGQRAEMHYASLVRELKSDRVSSTEDMSPHISRCKDYVYSHLHRNLQVQDIASAIGLEPNYLSALFKKCEHVTLKQYIINAKIRLVQNLLTYSDYSCIEIASYLGFSSQSHMGEHFRRVTGMTPRKYREKYRKNDFLNEFR